jgi:hypothetical protein
MYRIWFFCIIAAGMIVACAEPDDTNNFVYLGPVMIVEDLNVSYLDSGRVAVKVSTAIQQKMKNEDEVYPKTVYVNFINKDGVEYSSLRGDSGKYFKSENYYLIQGNVFVYNREQQQSLSTNELIIPTRKLKSILRMIRLSEMVWKLIRISAHINLLEELPDIFRLTRW